MINSFNIKDFIWTILYLHTWKICTINYNLKVVKVVSKCMTNRSNFPHSQISLIM